MPAKKKILLPDKIFIQLRWIYFRLCYAFARKQQANRRFFSFRISKNVLVSRKASMKIFYHFSLSSVIMQPVLCTFFLVQSIKQRPNLLVMGLWEACMLIFFSIKFIVLIQEPDKCAVSFMYHGNKQLRIIIYSQTFSYILKIIMYIIVKGPLDDLYIWVALNSFIVKLRRGG